MSDYALLVTALFLVIVSGVLVASEIAITRVSKVTIEQLKKDGVKKAAKLFDLLDDRTPYVNALLFAHLALSTIAIVLVTDGLIGIFGDNLLAVGLSAGIMITVGYVFLGVAPQTLGRQKPERIALATLGLARFITVFLEPLSRLFIALGNAIGLQRGSIFHSSGIA
jgi:CBS domain containing-hemolysin-like protein